MPTLKRFVISIAGATLFSAVAAIPASADWPGPLRAVGVKGPLGDEQLSDETTVTRVGYPTRKYKIRSGPATSYHMVGRLRYYTEDSAPENYLVLRSKLGPNGSPWLNIRVPRRPNGSKGWVPARALRMRTLTTAFEIDKAALKARLFKDGHEIWTSSVGIGAPGTPTPSGRFWVRERLPNLGGNSAYGPFAFGTSAYSRPVGMAGRRRRGHPRHQRTRPDPGPAFTRLRPRPEQQDPAAQEAHAGRHADLDPQLSASGRARS